MSLAQAVPEETVATTEVPKVTLELITGTREDVQRSGGVFTKDDLINIKLYVKEGLALPSQIGQVEAYVGYKKAGIEGLEPPEIKDLFDQVRAHCLSWDGVESKVFDQSIALETSAKKIVRTGDSFEDIVKQWPFAKKLEKLEAARAEEIKFTDEDTPYAMTLGEYLDSLRREFDDQEKKTRVVYNSVYDFRVVLAGGLLVDGSSTPGLEPQVKQKYNLMGDNGLRDKITGDEEVIKEKEARIDQLTKDQKEYTKLAFTGAVGGGIGLAITGGIFGAKAEKARKEKNKLIAEVRELRAKVKNEKNLQKAIDALRDRFSSLGTRMVEAQIALEHLQFMWQTMLGKIEASQKEWANVDNGKSLLTFLNVFDSIITPWRDVGVLSGQLVASMREALDEYKKTYAK